MRAAFFPHTSRQIQAAPAVKEVHREADSGVFPPRDPCSGGRVDGAPGAGEIHTFINRLPHNWPVYTTAARVSPDVKDANQPGEVSLISEQIHKQSQLCMRLGKEETTFRELQ